MFPKKIYFVRHGSTGPENQGRLVGVTDIAVWPEGRKSIARLKTDFAGVIPGAIYCSPLLRTCQTLDSLKGHCGWSNEVIYDERLKEMNFGDWEMKTWPELMEKNSELMAAMARYEGFVFPGGEEVDNFIKRVAEMLFLFKKSAAQDLVVISHGGGIRTLICLALGLSARNYLLFNVKPASLTIVELYEDGGILGGMNL